MPALTDITRYKRLAEIFVLAMKAEPEAVSEERRRLAIRCLVDHGMSERKAERFLEAAVDLYERNMLRRPSQTLKDVSTMFRRSQHATILQQLQAIIEAGDVGENHQRYFDLCFQHLYHGNPPGPVDSEPDTTAA